MSELTQRGIAAMKSGNKSAARDLLQQATEINPNDGMAWLWLSGAVENDIERAACLHQVLRIDPNNIAAQRALNDLENKAGAKPTIHARPPAPAVSPFTLASEPTPTPYQQPQVFTTPPEPAADLRSAFQSMPADSPSAFSGMDAEPDEEAAKVTLPVPKKSKLDLSGLMKSPRAMLYIGGGVVGLLAIVTIIMGVYIFGQLTAIDEQSAQAVALVLDTPTVTPTPTRTHVPTWTFTPTATERPTRTPTPSETPIPLGPIALQQSEKIAKQVAELRELPIKGEAPLHILTRDKVEKAVRELFSDQINETLQDEQRSLTALGLIKPDYDLVKATLNHLVDGLGGFYIPKTKDIYVLGLRFGGVEHYIYSHEYNHALIDQNFETENAQAETCKNNSDACTALTSLIEGDASLTMDQWWKDYASKADYQDILMYHPPYMAIPDQSPPPFLSEDVQFPYKQGLVFVKYLYQQGAWGRVNKAYSAPPQTTEQIMHPKKFTAGEVAIPVEPPPIEMALGDRWKMIRSDVLGEWTTYLMLAFNANEQAQIDETSAQSAAAGWGGNHYQVYYQAEKNQLALASKWAWDTEKDAAEFYVALNRQIDLRFNGSRADRKDGECWQADGQLSCVYISVANTLWLTAPDTETMDLMLALYPEFKMP